MSIESIKENFSGKHIGIVVVTTVGACICAKEIVAAAAREDFNNIGNHPEYTMHAFSFDQYKNCVLEKDWDSMAILILNSIDKLKSAGAEFIIIPSNTPHYAIEKIQKYSPLPVVNLIEVTADECAAKKYKKVLVLGTKATMQEGLYSKALLEKNIQAVIPDETLSNQINRLIMDEIIPSKINPKTVEGIKEAIKKLNSDAAILGCTELPEVYNKENLGLPVVDTTRLLAQKALDISTTPEVWHNFVSSHQENRNTFFNSRL